jgi:hypothetical protein
MQSEGGGRGSAARSPAGRCARDDLHRVAGPPPHDPRSLQDRRRADSRSACTSRRARSRPTPCRSSAITATSWRRGARALRSSPPAPRKKRKTSPPWRTPCHAARARIPVMHFFDGFRTSHEMTASSRCSDDDTLRAASSPRPLQALSRACDRSRSPHRSVARPESRHVFQGREAVEPFYARSRMSLAETMETLGRLAHGREVSTVRLRGSPRGRARHRDDGLRRRVRPRNRGASR